MYPSLCSKKSAVLWMAEQGFLHDMLLFARQRSSEKRVVAQNFPTWTCFAAVDAGNPSLQGTPKKKSRKSRKFCAINASRKEKPRQGRASHHAILYLLYCRYHAILYLLYCRYDTSTYCIVDTSTYCCSCFQGPGWRRTGLSPRRFQAQVFPDSIPVSGKELSVCSLLSSKILLPCSVTNLLLPCCKIVFMKRPAAVDRRCRVAPVGHCVGPLRTLTATIAVYLVVPRCSSHEKSCRYSMYSSILSCVFRLRERRVNNTEGPTYGHASEKTRKH